MIEYKDRLAAAMRDAGISVQGLADAIGLSYQAVKKALDGGSNSFSAKNNSKAASILKVNPNWLATGEGSKELYSTLFKGIQNQEPSNVSATTIATRRIPLISLVAAGTWCEAMDTFQVGDAQEWIETTANVTKGGYALRVEGDSMEPKFPHGAILIVDPNEQARNGSFVIVRQNGSDATFKQLVIDGGQSMLKPLNDRYPIMAMRQDAVICGVVKRVEMDV